MASQKVLNYRDDIKKVIDAWDPIRIIRFSQDEYQSDIDEIIDKISFSSESLSIAKAINRTFKRRYGPEYEYTIIDCINISNKIYGIMHN